MRRELNRLWRLFGTAVAFAMLGGVGFVTAWTAYPVAIALARDSDDKQRRIQAIVHRLFGFYIDFICWMGVIDVDIEGAEHLRRIEGKVVIANHPSLLDIVLLMALIPRATCIVKRALVDNPFLGPGIRGAGYLANDLDSETLIAACDATLKAGNNFIIFPEGTRSAPGQPFRAKRGFAHIAVLTRSDLQLVDIRANPLILGKNQPWHRIPDSRPKFRVQAGETLDIDRFLGYRYQSVSARRLTAYVEQYFAA